MVAHNRESSALVIAMMELFPPSVRESLINDPKFCHTYGLKADAQISFDDNKVIFQRSRLFESIRKIFVGNDNLSRLIDTLGEEWQIELVKQKDKSFVALTHEQKRFILPDFYAFSHNQKERLDGFNREADEFNFIGDSFLKWKEILNDRPLNDEEFNLFYTDINETPRHLEVLVRSEITSGKQCCLIKL